MEIRSISLYELRIPFLFNITHTLKSRGRSYSIVVVIETTDGTFHYGEGAPREYVIDEPKTKVQEAFRKISAQINSDMIDTLDGIKIISDTLSDSYGVPSLSCAIEIALLDIYSLSNNTPIYDLLSNSNIEHELSPYTGVISTEDSSRFMDLIQLVKKIKLPHIKIKVGHSEDVNNVRTARELLGENVDIRIDANRAWSYDQAIKKLEKFYPYNVSAVEEPLLAGETKNLTQLAEEINIPVILDESAYNMEQTRYYADHISSAKLIFNQKISKSGGPLRASAIFKYAQSHDIPCILGCNVGESAILSATGRSYAQAHPLRHLEGSYAPYFMEADIGAHPMTFTTGGRSDRITTTGLGVHISKKNMQGFSKRIDTIVK